MTVSSTASPSGDDLGHRWHDVSGGHSDRQQRAQIVAVQSGHHILVDEEVRLVVNGYPKTLVFNVLAAAAVAIAVCNRCGHQQQRQRAQQHISVVGSDNDVRVQLIF